MRIEFLSVSCSFLSLFVSVSLHKAGWEQRQHGQQTIHDVSLADDDDDDGDDDYDDDGVDDQRLQGVIVVRLIIEIVEHHLRPNCSTIEDGRGRI